MSHVVLIAKLEQQVKGYGLCILSPPVAINGSKKAANKRFNTVLLVGSAGSDFWRHFEASTEYLDSDADPLDRWSRRVGAEVTAGLECEVLLPSDGPPYWPFLSWSQAAGQSRPSSLGLHMHDQYGLWHAYRFAVAFNYEGQTTENAAGDGLHEACVECVSRPCLSNCPVNAFAEGHFDVESCAEYLREQPQSACNQQGCQARRACPMGAKYQYAGQHAQFHMQEFVKAHPIPLLRKPNK